MQTLDQCLQKLVSQGLIDRQTAASKAHDKTLFLHG